MVTDLVPDGLFPEFSGDLLSQITTSRQRMLDKVQNIAEHHGKESVEFQVLVGDAGSDSYKPARALCRDLQVAEIRPFRIYVGYDRNQHYHKFTDYVVQHAPCDVGIIKVDSNDPVTRWVGISSRNLKASAAALTRAFHDAHAGDLVVAIHYPVNPFLEIGGSVYEAHFSSVCDDNLDATGLRSFCFFLVMEEGDVGNSLRNVEEGAGLGWRDLARQKAPWYLRVCFSLLGVDRTLRFCKCLVPRDIHQMADWTLRDDLKSLQDQLTS
eukprot:symbB.v1.2.013528.t1/scaffold795.1/size259473/20